ncbi:MAG: RibD family protein [Planctomycetota bacterium]|jgi:3,4-dihydroxy 2-butanone 4-phosphate synthase/GTP cyclohydrolase II
MKNSLTSIVAMKNSLTSIEDLRTALDQASEFRKKNGRPFIAVSYAQSLDGSIATASRQPMQLSGSESMCLTHQLRACSRFILVGIGTVLADNPRLTVRLVEGENPQPIILDTHLRTPPDANLVQRSDLSTWIVNGNHNLKNRNDTFKQEGITLISCKCNDDGLIDLLALMDILARRQVNSIMVEGGARVITSFVKLKLVDLFVITISPKLVGGLPVIDARSFKTASSLELTDVHYQQLGVDLVVWARPDWSNR